MISRRERVFITGASGFIGANIARYLAERGVAVHALIRKSSSISGDLSKLWRLKGIKRNITFHSLNLNDKKLKALLRKIKPHYIFHLAAYGAYSWQTSLDRMIKTNIGGTLNLLEATLNLDYKCLINTGTSSEYGFKKEPMREDMALEPASYYALTKASATFLSSLFAKKYDKPIITFRLFSVYGPYEDKKRLIPTAFKAAISKKPLHLTDGKVMRDFIYIQDVIDAFEAAVSFKNLKGEIFNIGTGQQHSNEEVGAAIAKISETGLEFNSGRYKKRAWDSNYWVADISKAKKNLRWAPKYDLSQGLKETYFWFCKNLHYYL